MRELLFSVTKADLVITTFRASGNGGQHRNKTASAVRIQHPASGAMATATEYKSQLQNKRAALKRLVATKAFQAWHRIEASIRCGQMIKVKEWVDKMMDESNIRVEIKKDGKWVAE